MGSASTAAMITSAWSTSRTPSASATRTGSCAGVASAVAIRAARWAPARVCRVWWASQFAVEVAPEAASTSTTWPWAVTRARELGELGLEEGELDQHLTGLGRAHRPHRDVAHVLSRSSIRAAATPIGWTRSMLVAVAVMGPF